MRNDSVNDVSARLSEFDGFVFGSAVHYAAASGALSSFMDRLFYSSSRKLMFKPAACIASCRRGGATATFDVLNKYFTINQMPVVASTYWNQVYRSADGTPATDAEGQQTLQNLATNMAWLLKCIAHGQTHGITPPDNPKTAHTGFLGK